MFTGTVHSAFHLYAPICQIAADDKVTCTEGIKWYDIDMT